MSDERKPSNVHRLIPDRISHDVVEALEQLLDGARQGEIEGFAFVVRMPGQQFFCNAAGSARSDPHATRGFVLALLDELRDIASGQQALDACGKG